VLIFAIHFSELCEIRKSEFMDFSEFPLLRYEREASTVWPVSGVSLLLSDE
jgi:hypothetical protein